MPWSITPRRRDEPELMDAPGLSEKEVAAAYRTLATVNRQLGNLRSVRREAERFVREDGPWEHRGPIRVLDVGSGSGDIPALLGRDLLGTATGGSAAVITLDRDPTAASLARRNGLVVVRGDALRLPFADRSLDFVTAVKFAHHFSGPSLARLIGEMARVSRHRVLVLGIRRHWLA